MTPYSVIIPAHNEAQVIGRCLETLLAGGEKPEILVVCNGCSDGTADVVRQLAPQVKVIELEQGSKPLALNAGNAAATAWPRFFVDADIELSLGALKAAARPLRDGSAMASAPALRVDTDGCDGPVRSYYDVWMAQPYVHSAMVGSGVYGLSEAGMGKVVEFPPIIADDGYVRTRFSEDERVSVSVDQDGNPVWFTVRPPRDFLSLVRVESRRRSGDAQLRALFPSPYTGRTTRAETLASPARGSPIDLFAFLAIKTAGRALFKWKQLTGNAEKWSRDDSSRAQQA